MKVKGKDQLCVCNDYKKYFKSIQGLGSYTLFGRYNDLENVVNKRVDEKYRHFLAQPEVDGNNIQWFSVPYYKEPKRLSELDGDERANYEKIKNDTLSHYKRVVEELKAHNKNSEAEALGNAIKFVNDDFVYCYDGKTVLGVWGMELRDEVREPLGIAMKNTFEKPRIKNNPVIQDPVPETSDPEEPETIDPEESGTKEPIEQPNDDDILYNVKFDFEENGSLRGRTEYKMRQGERITDSMIPDAEANEGYEFVGWDVEPNNYEVENDVVFTAQFRKKAYKVRFFDGGHGSLRGQTEYDKSYEEQILTDEIPEVVADKEYKFVGWDKNPVNYVVREDVAFTALYKENVRDKELVSWWSRFAGWGSGCLNWLLSLLLIGLIGLLLWYLLGKHNLNFCGCNCNETVITPPGPKPSPGPTPTPDPNHDPSPVLKPCDELQRSGNNTPESFIFEMGQESGSFLFEYATGGKYKDEIVIYDGENNKGKRIFEFNDITGGDGWYSRQSKRVRFSNNKIYIEITPDSNFETYWEIKVNCP